MKHDKYEMLPKAIIDNVCTTLQDAQSSVSKLKMPEIMRRDVMQSLDDAYKAIQKNRKPCNA